MMASYNEIDGVPSHANRWLLRDVLRKEWGFKGFIVSDYYAIWELHETRRTRPATTSRTTGKQRGRLAVQAGVNIELPEPDCYPHLVDLVRKGTFRRSRTSTISSRRCCAGSSSWDCSTIPTSIPTRPSASSAATRHRALALQAAREDDHAAQERRRRAAARRAPGQDASPSSARTPTAGCSAATAACRPRTSPCSRASALRVGPPASRCSTRRLQDHHRRLVAAGRGDRRAIPTRTGADRRGGQGRGAGRRDRARHRRQRADLARGVGRKPPGRRHQPRSGRPAGRAGRRHRRHRASRSSCSCSTAVRSRSRASPRTRPRFSSAGTSARKPARAVADVLFGDVNPGGKLPITIPRSVGHLPAFYNHKPSARRGYLFDDCLAAVPVRLRPELHDVRLRTPQARSRRIGADDTTRVSVDVTNTGTRPATKSCRCTSATS